ncbi:hypothetical protein CLV24_11728 [Pontibacter ummariensis]|uniref:Nal1 C-terminal domain-containing protein n=1 Tax=Pontibacter ummariensis TaxID=1610492 RepID=A0A239IFH1_9BACT|nr:hypothetical protein [Pontibacter ummariensis]PRY09824.1 hypothetical protein CLV24_11728 [Pontibacter ummariensis]SNS92305.1 hypothetical protein SAMN06296052_11728 [Pontibacter ummariensis]
MKQPNAIHFKNKLSEAFITRPSALIKSFSLLERRETALLANFSSRISGVGLGQSGNGDYYIRLLTVSALDRNDVMQISQSIGVKPNDISIEETGPIHFFNAPIRTRARPAPPGASIGHYLITAGTFGCLVQDNNGNVFILSNNHVMANENDAHVGDPILQPGSTDGGSAQHDIVAWLKSFVPFDFSGLNQVDAAIAAPASSKAVTNIIPHIGQIRGITAPRNGMRVVKFGRTTGLTYGEIVSRDTDIKVGFGNGVINFENQFEISSRDSTFSAPGDSGSLIVEEKTNKAVGLLFAGSDSATFANPISNVLQAFDVDII